MRPQGFFPRTRLTGAAILTFMCLTAHAAGSQQKTEAPAFFRLMLGDYEITVLWDGTSPRQFDRIMSKPTVIRELYERNHEDLPAEMSINGFLVNTGSKLLLIDSGGGNAVGPRAGRLMTNLEASGYTADQVDAVLLTHMHPDHISGLVANGKRAFPNALIYVDKRDPDYWLSPADKGSPTRQSMSQQAHTAMDPYVTAGMLRPFEGGTSLFPGVQAVPSSGHTTGHTAYMIESKGKRLLLWGDIIHSAEAQFRDPQITIQFDMSPEDAIQSRKRLLTEAAQQGYLVGGAHITFPGLGHVTSDGQSYSWVQLPYTGL